MADTTGADRRIRRRPPLVVTGNVAPEGTRMAPQDERRKAKDAGDDGAKRILPSSVGLLVPLVVSFAGIMFATMYRVPWLVIVSCLVAGTAIAAWILHSRRQARWQESTDIDAREEKVRAYRRDLEETLVGYDIDRDVSDEQIDAFVAEYRHKLEVESTNLAVAGPLAILRGLFGRRRSRRHEELSEEAEARAAAAEARRMLVRQAAAERNR